MSFYKLEINSKQMHRQTDLILALKQGSHIHAELVNRYEFLKT